MIDILIIYALLTSAMFYLGSRALITKWVWSRYPKWLARWADCSACSGAWYGLAVGILGTQLLSNPPGILAERWSPIVVMLCSIVWTPIVSGYMQRGFEMLGSAIREDGDAE